MAALHVTIPQLSEEACLRLTEAADVGSLMMSPPHSRAFESVFASASPPIGMDGLLPEVTPKASVMMFAPDAVEQSMGAVPAVDAGLPPISTRGSMYAAWRRRNIEAKSALATHSRPANHTPRGGGWSPAITPVGASGHCLEGTQGFSGMEVGGSAVHAAGMQRGDSPQLAFAWWRGASQRPDDARLTAYNSQGVSPCMDLDRARAASPLGPSAAALNVTLVTSAQVWKHRNAQLIDGHLASSGPDTERTRDGLSIKSTHSQLSVVTSRNMLGAPVTSGASLHSQVHRSFAPVPSSSCLDSPLNAAAALDVEATAFEDAVAFLARPADGCAPSSIVAHMPRHTAASYGHYALLVSPTDDTSMAPNAVGDLDSAGAAPPHQLAPPRRDAEPETAPPPSRRKRALSSTTHAPVIAGTRAAQLVQPPVLVPFSQLSTLEVHTADIAEGAPSRRPPSMRKRVKYDEFASKLDATDVLSWLQAAPQTADTEAALDARTPEDEALGIPPRRQWIERPRHLPTPPTPPVPIRPLVSRLDRLPPEVVMGAVPLLRSVLASASMHLHQWPLLLEGNLALIAESIAFRGAAKHAIGMYATHIEGQHPGESPRMRRLALWHEKRSQLNWSKEAQVRYPHRAEVVARRVRAHGRFH